MTKIVDNFFFVSFFDRIEQKIKYLNTEKVGRTWYDNSVRVGDDARGSCHAPVHQLPLRIPHTVTT